MTKREQQYINWHKFWNKMDKNKPIKTIENIDGIKFYKIVVTGGRIRVPDYMLKKMHS